MTNVVTYYEHGRFRPAINIKHPVYINDLLKHRNDDEFSSPGFWEWLEDEYWSDSDSIETAVEIARETCWDSAFEAIELVWKAQNIRICSAGRSGGWLIIDGMADVDDWDADDHDAYNQYRTFVQNILDDFPYQIVWHAFHNIWLPTIEEPRIEAEQWTNAIATRINALVTLPTV